MNLKKLLVFIEKWGLFLLVTFTSLLFVLSVKEAAGNTQGELHLSILEAFVNTVTSGSDTAQGWTKRMHFLLNVTLAWAAVRVYMATAGLKWDSFVARWLARNHVVIVAGRNIQNSEPGNIRSNASIDADDADKSALAVDIALSLAEIETVVLCLPDVDEGSRAKLWTKGVTLLTDNLSMADILVASGARRASQLIAMRDYYGDNIALTRSVLSPSFRNQEIKCKCLVEPLSVMRTFDPEDYFEPSKLPQVRIFNESEIVARRIVRVYPPDSPVAMSDKGVHLLLIGLDSVGQAILVQLARIGHYRSGSKPKITVVDKNVKAQWRQVLDAHEGIERWIQVETQESSLGEIGPDEIDRWLNDERKITMTYVCTDDEIANLRIARLLLRSLKEQEQVLGDSAGSMVVALEQPGGTVLSEFASQEAEQGRFRLYSLSDTGQSDVDMTASEGLLSDFDDDRARLFHDAYCKRDAEECARNSSRKPATFNLPWSKLPETVRNANRRTADHFDVKLRAVGCQVVAAQDVKAAQLSEGEIELLAKMEHDRWWADRTLDGWTLGEQRDNKRKIHPNMLDYEQLSERVKQLDRDSVNQMFAVFEGEGLRVTRVRSDSRDDLAF